MSRVKKRTDEELARLAAAGRKRDFGILLKRYSGRIYNLAYRFSGNRAAAEDITQDTFIKVYQALPGADLERPFKPWLYRIAVNTAVSYLRKVKPALNDELIQTKPSKNKGPDDLAIDLELQGRLQSAILKLPLKYRRVVVLRYLENITFHQISEILNIPEGTAKTNFQRAKIILKRELTDFFETK
ncbi:MAG TPA: sigma-70 family RNA polymerase sigma factor [Actinobacteria bacterium]|nr:sigma-70 family RNA polymerase sigma factor [Actinomycetes bacterium]HEX21667.1 sigma-70 family RNA polymerase sigma factor [Actinomycetota bacterium]